MIKLNGKSIITKLFQPTTIVIFAALLRLLPHMPNFAPIAGMALFGGVYMNRKQALFIPILAMIISDIFIGFDSFPMRLAVYGSFLIIIGIGFWLRNHRNYKNIAAASFMSSLIFFLITNFAVWAFSGMYANNLFGLSQSYYMAIPFFRNTIVGDLFYSGIFFGGYELVTRVFVRRSIII